MLGEKINKALTSPLFHAGVGLLSIDDARQGPKAALQGALQGRQLQQQAAEQQRLQEERERQKALAQQAAAAYQSGGIGAVVPTLLGDPSTMAAGATLAGKMIPKPTTQSQVIPPEEAAQLGLPAGGVYQRDSSGKISAVYSPPASSQPEKLDTERLAGSLALQRDMESFAQNPDLFYSATGLAEGSMVGGIINRALGRQDVETARRKLERISSSAVLDAASNLKGAASDRDIALIRETAPSTSDQPEVWIDWYNNDVVPRLNFHYNMQHGMTPFKPIEMAQKEAATPSAGGTGRNDSSRSAVNWSDL